MRQPRDEALILAVEVEFFFSPASRYSYLAASQITGLEQETGCSWYGDRCTDPIPEG